MWRCPGLEANRELLGAHRLRLRKFLRLDFRSRTGARCAYRTDCRIADRTTLPQPAWRTMGYGNNACSSCASLAPAFTNCCFCRAAFELLYPEGSVTDQVPLDVFPAPKTNPENAS